MALSQVIAAAPVIGPFVSWWKIIPLVIVLILWGRLATWMDKDSQNVMLPRVPINLGNLFGGIIGLILFFVLPGFAIALLVFCLVVIAEAGVYLVMRAQKSGLGDIGDQFKDWTASFSGGEKKVKEVQGEVQIVGKNGNLVAAPEAEAPERAGYEAAQSLLTEPLRRGAEQIDLMPADGAAVVKYMVDGVSYPANSIDKARASSAVHYLKLVSGQNVEERRKPQTSTMKVAIDGVRHDIQIQTAGSTAGEQLRAMVDMKKRHEYRLEALGMPDDQIEHIREVIHDTSGLVLLSAPKGHGLTTLEYAVLRAHDAFLLHIQTIEREPSQDIEGVTQNKVAQQQGEPLKSVEWISSQEPDVLLVDRIEDGKSAAVLNKYAASGKRVYVGLRAGSTFDALAAWRQLIGDDSAAVKNLRMIVNARVLRKLCPACKQPFAPDPNQLRKLNMDPEQVQQLFQARTQPLRDPKGNPITCEFCKELHFRGRAGVYEVFMIDDEVRSVVESGGSINQLKSVFRKQRAKYLQEMALQKVAAGDTSIQEVLRVMKSDDTPRSVKK